MQKKTGFCALFLLLAGVSHAVSVTPLVKRFEPAGGMLEIGCCLPGAGSELTTFEWNSFVELIDAHGLHRVSAGIQLRLEIGDVPLPEIKSVYREEIASQAYSITVDQSGVVITGASNAGAFYGMQTFGQLIGNSKVPMGRIVDWPDFPVRMIMIDPARQNENFDYYRRVIDFAGQYKMNAVLCHLTDDQTSALYHEDYPELMHPHAWRPKEIADLAAFARERHVELIPEIESLGHSRMFTLRGDFKDFLHQTTGKPAENWMGTSIEGYTNVLCPASGQAREYLDRMYARAAETFQSRWLHVGCDEVDVTHCARCAAAYGALDAGQWMRMPLAECRELGERRAEKIGYWGDMLLAHPEALEEIPPARSIVFDWHYNADVNEDSVRFFKQRGYEVIACPSLVCAPHLLLPDAHNFQNIDRFTAIARENDLLGVNTTIWIPQRYMSDALWTGIAYSAAQAWSGSEWNESDFFRAFGRDYFETSEGEAYRAAWSRLTAITWHRTEFYTACWMDDASLADAQKLAAARGDEVKSLVRELDAVTEELARIGQGITKHKTESQAIEQSAVILRYTMEHLLAASRVREGTVWNKSEIGKLDNGCVEAIEWIERDWDRNRYKDDANKNGIHTPNQHLLYRFRQMHEYHNAIIMNQSSK